MTEKYVFHQNYIYRKKSLDLAESIENKPYIVRKLSAFVLFERCYQKLQTYLYILHKAVHPFSCRDHISPFKRTAFYLLVPGSPFYHSLTKCPSFSTAVTFITLKAPIFTFIVPQAKRLHQNVRLLMLRSRGKSARVLESDPKLMSLGRNVFVPAYGKRLVF